MGGACVTRGPPGTRTDARTPDSPVTGPCERAEQGSRTGRASPVTALHAHTAERAGLRPGAAEPSRPVPWTGAASAEPPSQHLPRPVSRFSSAPCPSRRNAVFLAPASPSGARAVESPGTWRGTWLSRSAQTCFPETINGTGNEGRFTFPGRRRLPQTHRTPDQRQSSPRDAARPDSTSEGHRTSPPTSHSHSAGATKRNKTPRCPAPELGRALGRDLRPSGPGRRGCWRPHTPRANSGHLARARGPAPLTCSW